MAEFQFPKRLRLLKPPEFERVMAARASASDGLVRMYGAANELGHPRLGLMVSRKVGSATARNRWKRALREAFRLGQHELPDCDIICIPQRDATPDVRALTESLRTLARRIDQRLRRGSAP
jgi:ribonuclease P protein component